jgi:hypothetical protein
MKDSDVEKVMKIFMSVAPYAMTQKSNLIDPSKPSGLAEFDRMRTLVINQIERSQIKLEIEE